MFNLAIIPARSGSKRIPKKNIRNFCGMPIIAYSIEAALNSRCFDEVMVSTDSEEIANISRNYGASVPFLRSDETSTDSATTADVILEVLNSYAEIERRVDQFACIYPTAPFVTEKRLRDAMVVLNEANAVVSVVRYDYPPQRALVVRKGNIVYQYPEFEKARSQDLEQIYHDCGQFYMCKCDQFLKYLSLIPPGTKPFIIPDEEAQDIDILPDWKIAELKYLALREKEKKYVSDF